MSEDAIAHLSELMKIPEARINEVFHFYTMFNKKPVGKLHVQVCNNISCCMNGSRDVITKLCTEFGVGIDEMTADGKLTVTPVECLGSCDTAPMMQVNDRYYENLTPESAFELVKGMEV